MRIGFLHTSSTLAERFRAEMSEKQPHVDCFHVTHEGMLQDLTRGVARVVVHRRVVQQILLVAESGVGLVVTTCSSTSPAVDIARQVCAVPVLKLDDPMAGEAVRLGRRIAVLCTDTTTPGPVAALLRVHASMQGREVLVETVVRPEAHTAMFAGDVGRHDAVLDDAAGEVSERADVIVLAGGLLERLQGPLGRHGRPVVASPGLLMTELARRLAPGRAAG